MDKRTTGIIATFATAVLCGCPGLIGLCIGAVTSLVSFIPDADINIIGNNDPGSALLTGIGLLFVSLIFIAIPIVVGILTLRDRPKPADPIVSDEPLPPPN